MGPRVISLIVGVMLLTGCAATSPPNLLDHLQTQAQLQDKAVATQLTDLGILHFGESILTAWGLRSQKTEAVNMTGQIALAALSTGALVASGGGASPDVSRGLIGGFNFLLQLMGIIKPAERNDARHEGAAMILDARGNFLLALAEKKIYHVRNDRFTFQGALYFRQINAALKVVDRLLVGLAPRIEDLKALEPIPAKEQPDPGPERDDPPIARLSGG